MHDKANIDMRIIWEEYINSLIDSTNHLDKTKLRLKEVLKNIPKITISGYKKLAYINTEEEWNLYKSNNRDLFSNFFQRVYQDMMKKDLDEIEYCYNNSLDIIARTLKIPYDEILHTLITLRYYMQKKDMEKVAVIKAKLIEYYRKFIILYKKDYIENATQEQLQKIKNKFVLINNQQEAYAVDPSMFINYIKQDDRIIEAIKEQILTNFGIELNKVDFEKLLFDIISKNDYSALDLLNIEKPDFYDDIDEMKAIKRLRNNYYPQLIKKIPQYMLEHVQKYLNDPITNKHIKLYFNNDEVIFLNEIVALMSESKSTLDLNSEEKFVSIYKEFDTDSKNIMKEYQYKLSKLNELKKQVHKLYNTYSENYQGYGKLIKNYSADKRVPFNDENYELDDLNYIFNDKILTDFLNNIDSKELEEMPDYMYIKLKELLSKDNIFAAILYSDLSDIKLEDLINNFSKIYYDIDFSMSVDNLNEIIKKIKLSEYATKEQIELLGNDVVRKIITNNQFMSGNTTSEDIKLRLRKAEDLMKRSESINTSAVPYNCDVSKNGVNVVRYLNNDPQLLVSGIDANTCFKLGANDNDFVFYTVLSKNGFVLKFTDEKGKLIGRISGIRRNNVLQFNSIRNSENSNIISTKEQLELSNNMLLALEEYASKIIEATKDSDCPIDFVVCNKSGLLESSEFCDRYPMLNQHLFDNPIDIYGDDWKEFVHTYDNKKENYFQQVDDKTIFTTDFGSYPVVMIKAREGKYLEKLWDISYTDPEAIYLRPDSKVYADSKNSINSKKEI